MTIPPAVLPPLRGVWLWLYRLVFAAALVTALFATAATNWLDIRRDSNTTPQTWSGALYGLGVRILPPAATEGWRIAALFSAESHASGMRARDAVIAINGKPLTGHSGVPPFAKMIDAREGGQAKFTLRGRDGIVRDRVVAWHASNIAAWYRGSGLNPWRQTMARRILYDLSGLLLLLPATLLFLRRPREIVAGAFALSLCLISIEPTEEFWAAAGMVHAYQILAALPYILVLMFGCAFPNGRFTPAWSRFSLVLAPLLFAPFMLKVEGFGKFAFLTAPAFPALFAVWALHYRKLPVGAERQQFRWVGFGIVGGTLTLLSRVVLAFVQDGLTPAPLSPWVDLSGSFVHALGYAIIGAGFAVALLKYRLYDAEAVISRSVALTATTLMLAGVWAASEKAIEVTLALQLGIHEEAIASAIGAGVAVIVVTPLHRPVHEWLDRRFSAGVWRLRERLPGVAAALSQRAGTQALCDTMLDHVARAVSVTRAALVIQRGADRIVVSRLGLPPKKRLGGLKGRGLPAAGGMVEEMSDFPFRLALAEEDNRASAWLLLGPRPDGTPCNRDQRQALEELAAPLAAAIATTEARDARDNHLARQLSEFGKRLSAIEARSMIVT